MTRALAWLTLLAFSMMLWGCASTSAGGRAAEIDVSPAGVVSVAGRPVSLKRLPGVLRAAGAHPMNGVHVRVAHDTSVATLNQVTSTLASAGYSRVIFLRAKPPTATSRIPR